jgi:predicted AlkP superfamily phosphohydrolase/phosphomutase
MKHIHTFENFLNEGMKVTPKELTHEGEEALAWLTKIFDKAIIRSIEFDKNQIDIVFDDGVDLTSSLFNMGQKWLTAPAHLDLYVDVMSVNRGVLNAVIFGKAGMSFTV